MNFAGDVVDKRAPASLALLELGREGSRREWSYGEVTERKSLSSAGLDV